MLLFEEIKMAILLLSELCHFNTSMLFFTAIEFSLTKNNNTENCSTIQGTNNIQL